MSDLTISDLPAATSALLADEFPVNEAGTTKKVTLAQIQTVFDLVALTGRVTALEEMLAMPLVVQLDLGSGAVVGALPVSSPGLSGGMLQTITTLTNAATAYPVPATPQAGRASLLVQAADTNTAAIYLGKSTVTADAAATGGIKLLPGQSVPMQLAAAVLLYAISTAAGQKVVTLEVAA